MTLVLLSMLQGRTSGGHGLLEATPRIYEVTPDIPDRRRATQQKEVRPKPGRQPHRESARRPVGTISSTSDVTDEPNHNSKRHCDSDDVRLASIWVDWHDVGACQLPMCVGGFAVWHAALDAAGGGVAMSSRLGWV